ncbi:hypothetical protein [Sulfurospirillum sp.]|uniref:hypothetical protein n=1 Tax=Sulfurospirillum sp. TaxID=2053622 RepID=UPI002FDE1A73
MNRKEFKEALKKLQITQEQFANEVGYSYAAVKGWDIIPKWVPMVLNYKMLLKSFHNTESISTTINILKQLQEKVQNLD